MNILIPAHSATPKTPEGVQLSAIVRQEKKEKTKYISLAAYKPQITDIPLSMNAKELEQETYRLHAT